MCVCVCVCVSVFVCVALPGLKHRPDFTIITFLEIRLKQKEKEKSEIKGNHERKENYKEKIAEAEEK